ncbi:VanW family protein [Longivirga aurantiaca]|uniref:VanW family protein n=1 Tax=Longivirga aurantiaca TaxID=1837743 RepID=A0ABW1SY95_9ACTN
MTATPDTTSPDQTAPDPASRGWQRPLLWVGIAVLLLGAFYAALVASSGDGLPRGAKVLGVDVGGLSEAEAAAKLDAELGPAATDPVNATIGEDSVSIVPADAGLSFDAEATVDGYAGRIWNPVTLILQFTGGPTLAPVIGVDQAALEATVKQLAIDSDTAPVEPSIEVRGSDAVLINGINGRAMDQPAAVQALASAYLVSTQTVDLPEIETTPSVPQDKADAALVVAKAAISGPVTVKAGKVTADIPAEAIGRALAFTPENGELVGSLDGAILRTSIEDDLAPVEKPGRDATWDVSSGKPVIVPSKVGRGINPDDLAVAVAGVMGQTSAAARVVTPELGTIQPKLTTEQAEKLGVVEKLGSFTQNFPYAAYRVQNIGTAARYINGTLLKPGEVFSLNKIIKERTVANGYTKGFVIGPGGVFKEDQGGGVSASATTAWSAAFYSGLERVYTQAHSIWIPRYRAGLEATVAWGAFDMKFRNDTKNGVFITTVMTNTSMTMTLWGTKVYDDIRAVSSAKRNTVPFDTLYDPSPTCNAQGGQVGFTIDVFRVFIKDGKEVKREKITTRYRPSPTVICGTDPKDEPTPSPSPSGSSTKSPSPKPSSTKSPSPSAT